MQKGCEDAHVLASGSYALLRSIKDIVELNLKFYRAFIVVKSLCTSF